MLRQNRRPSLRVDFVPERLVDLRLGDVLDLLGHELILFVFRKFVSRFFEIRRGVLNNSIIVWANELTSPSPSSILAGVLLPAVTSGFCERLGLQGVADKLVFTELRVRLRSPVEEVEFEVELTTSRLWTVTGAGFLRAKESVKKLEKCEHRCCASPTRTRKACRPYLEKYFFRLVHNDLDLLPAHSRTSGQNVFNYLSEQRTHSTSASAPVPPSVRFERQFAAQETRLLRPTEDPQHRSPSAALTSREWT